MEIFYLQDRIDELKRAKYGPYYIHRQVPPINIFTRNDIN